ncbi:MAG TPA: cytochrome b/b6 domain-containing protein, partial [Desulfosporosinus sp.]|nr:cytochrome b/b6 domain-containing protein [Desulfosporosinus sp.]
MEKSDDVLNIKRIYVWQIPIRLFHWINAICISILFTTGLFIGNPIVGVRGEAA